VIVSTNLIGDEYVKESALGKVRSDELMLNIGMETVNLFDKIISEARTIVWAGPMGLFENEKFANGTKQIAELIIKNKNAYKIAGGGDTVSAIEQLNLADRFNHVSSGGGAMLAFLGREKLSGIEALNLSH
jgi:phosphoglycerate kinase